MTFSLFLSLLGAAAFARWALVILAHLERR